MKISRVLNAKIDISGINRMELLKRLWDQRPPALFYIMNPEVEVPMWDHDKALRALNYGYIDYFCGRCIKTNLLEDIVDTANYDHEYEEHPELTFEHAVKMIKCNHSDDKKD